MSFEEIDVMLINGDPIEVAEMVAIVRERLGDTPRPSVEHVQRLVTEVVYGRIRNQLLYQEANREFDVAEAEAGLERAVDQEIKDRVGREFGGRQTRFEEHLRQDGRTIGDIRAEVRRDVVVQKYLYDKIMPRIEAPTRQQLWDFYQSHLEDYRQEASRELFLIQVSKGADAAAARTRAGDARARIIGGEAFDAVARDVSDGIHASDGGAWGQITSDLRGPYAIVSRTLNSLPAETVSDVVEGDTAWFIVKSGAVSDATVTSFKDIQDDLRQRFRMEQLNAHQRRLLGMLESRAIAEPNERVFINAVLWRLGKELTE